jgi:hypothetical protein
MMSAITAATDTIVSVRMGSPEVIVGNVALDHSSSLMYGSGVSTHN